MEGHFCQWGEHICSSVNPIKTFIGEKQKGLRYNVFWVCKDCYDELIRLEIYHLKSDFKKEPEKKKGSQLFSEREPSYYHKMLKKLNPSKEDIWIAFLKDHRKP